MCGDGKTSGGGGRFVMVVEIVLLETIMDGSEILGSFGGRRESKLCTRAAFASSLADGSFSRWLQ